MNDDSQKSARNREEEAEEEEGEQSKAKPEQTPTTTTTNPLPLAKCRAMLAHRLNSVSEYVPQTPLNSRQKLRKTVGKGPIKLYVLIMPMPPVALSAAFDHLSNCRVGGRWSSWRPKMRGYDVELERKPAENSHGRSRSIERS